MTTAQAVTERLKILMQAKNIAITDICEKCNLSQSTIYKILAAKQTSVEIHTLHQLAKAFDISLKEFFDNEMFDSKNIIKKR